MTIDVHECRRGETLTDERCVSAVREQGYRIQMWVLSLSGGRRAVNEDAPVFNSIPCEVTTVLAWYVDKPARAGGRIALVRICAVGSYNDRILNDDLRGWYGFSGVIPESDGSVVGGILLNVLYRC